MTAMTLTLQEERWCESQVEDLNAMMIADHPRVILDWAEEIFAPCLRFYFRPQIQDFLILRLLESIGSSCDLLVEEQHLAFLPEQHPYGSNRGVKVMTIQHLSDGLSDCEAWICSEQSVSGSKAISIDTLHRGILKINPLAHLSMAAIQDLSEQVLLASDNALIEQSHRERAKSVIRSVDFSARR